MADVRRNRSAMKNVRLLHLTGGLIFASLLAGCMDAAREGSDLPPLRVSSPMPVGGQVMAPPGFIGFCKRNAAECESGSDRPSTPELTPELWRLLNAVNDYVNRLPQIDDKANYGIKEYWTFPNRRGGDCEDFALEKRRLLIAQGQSGDAFLLATGQGTDDTLHAVLIAVTNLGDYVLDNKNWAIVPWAEATYVWKGRQSRERPSRWVALVPKASPSPAEAPNRVAVTCDLAKDDKTPG